MPEEPGHGASRYPPEVWRARLDLAACYRLADHFGFSDLVWNHITAKVPGTRHFLVNRFGLRFDEVTASNLVTVDLDGAVVDPGTGSSEEAVNVTGFVIHSAVHAARDDVRCVMHSHTAAGLAVSVLEDGLAPMILDALPLHGRLAYHDLEGLSTDPGERERLAADLGDCKAMILRNHGLLTCGETVGEAFVLMYYLERACRVQLDVLSTGQRYRVVPPEVCARVARQYARFPYGRSEWPALLRLVESKSPDYAR